MSAQKIEGSDLVEDQAEAVNEVRLVGRLAADPRLRELPSGDTVWTLRVVVERDLPPGKERMSTPTLGFGWNDVAFSGSSRSSAAILRTRSTSGAGISTATLSLRSLLRVASTEW